VLYTIPAPAAENILYRSPVEIGFSNPETEVDIQVFAGENQVSGNIQYEDEIVRFIPDAYFLPLQEYNVVVSYCEEVLEYTFETSALGNLVSEDLTGHTYVFDLRNATWTKPAGVGSLLSAQFTASILFGIETVLEQSFSPIITISEESSNAQDMCFPSIGGIVTADFSQNPYFEISPIDIDINLSGFPVQVGDFSLSGVMDETGFSYAHGVIAGVVDARNIALLINLGAQEVCDLLAGFGSPCGPCSDGNAFCFEIEATEMSGMNTELPLECVGYAYCHPLCSSSGCPNPDQGICSYE
jgi:hypothetical protein